MLYPDFKCCCVFTNVDNFGGGGRCDDCYSQRETGGVTYIDFQNTLHTVELWLMVSEFELIDPSELVEVLELVLVRKLGG